MIKEELYVIIGGERKRLDLHSPSGITLKWVSNLFNDLSKLTCSYSYTFNLPMTKNNREVLDMCEDIRTDSKLPRKLIDAEFYINGICLCPNANLYIDKIQKEYSCVMTWRVLRAFQTLKDSGLKLSDLPFEGKVYWGHDGEQGIVYGKPTTPYKNTDNLVYPDYDAGYPHTYNTPPKPCMPIYRIVQMINEYFGTQFVIGKEINNMGALPFHELNKDTDDDYVSHGAIPLCYEEGKVGMDYDIHKTEIEYSLTDNYGWSDYPCIAQIQPFVGNKYIKLLYTCGTYLSECEYAPSNPFPTVFPGGSPATFAMGISVKKEAKIYGRMDVYYPNSCCQELGINVNSRPWMSLVGFEPANDKEDGANVLYFEDGKNTNYYWHSNYKKSESEVTDGAKIVSNKDLENYPGLIANSATQSHDGITFHYDFGEGIPARRLTLSEGMYMFCGYFVDDFVQTDWWDAPDGLNDVNAKYGKVGTQRWYWGSYRDNYIRILDFHISKIETEGMVTFPSTFDIKNSLPDITCFNFMKSLFYMNGCMPKVEKDGTTISAMFYNQLRDRINDGTCIDWSDKLITSSSSVPQEQKFRSNHFAKNNYFEMQNSNLGKTDEEISTLLDVYTAGFGSIYCNDDNVDEEKKVFKSVFASAYTHNLRMPEIKVGNTYKLFNADATVNTEKISPLYGIMVSRKLNKTFEDVAAQRPNIANNTETTVRLNAFSPFENNMEELFSYLALLLNNYTMIKETFSLSEYDLYNFDESIPVYLSKYNSYFAVSTVQRKKDGICVAELVKLPYATRSIKQPEVEQPDIKPEEPTPIENIIPQINAIFEFIGRTTNFKQTFDSATAQHINVSSTSATFPCDMPREGVYVSGISLTINYTGGTDEWGNINDTSFYVRVKNIKITDVYTGRDISEYVESVKFISAKAGLGGITLTSIISSSYPSLQSEMWLSVNYNNMQRVVLEVTFKRGFKVNEKEVTNRWYLCAQVDISGLPDWH